MGGSHYVEHLTQELARRAWEHIQEVEAAGGMAKAIEQGIPKRRIEEAAARKQARIDSGQEQIVGVNVFVPDQDEIPELLEVDNEAVRQSQLRRIAELKAKRDEGAVAKTLHALREAARSNENLLEKAIDAARQRATLGEISLALEDIFGRYTPSSATISGVYRSAVRNDQLFEKAMHRADAFDRHEGRRPRILVCKLGQDGHDRGARVVASGFADLGFDVDVGPLFQTPEEAARQAIDNDVHVVGISSLAAGHKTLVPELRDALAREGREDIVIVVGGVIPPQDYAVLTQMGVAAIFGPGTPIAQAALKVLDILLPEEA